MKRFLSILAFAGSMCLSAFAQPPGLVGYWKLNGDLADSSGANNSGTLQFRGSPYNAFQPGVVGLALDSARGAYAKVPDSPSLSALGSATIEAWINPNFYPVRHTHPEYDVAPIVAKWGYAIDEEYILAITVEGRLEATFAGSAVGVRPVEIITSYGQIPLGTWTHVAVTLDTVARRFSLYINGVLDKAQPTTLPLADRDLWSPVYIGYMWVDDGGPKSFDGLIDEVKIWRLDEQERGLQTIEFSGHTWYVRPTSGGREQPGFEPGLCDDQPCEDNYWGGGRDNVWKDSQGRLHLKVRQREGRWECAEVWSAASFGYGTYRFYLDSPVDNLDPNIVFGLFTYSNNRDPYCYREIDIEFTRWGKPRLLTNAQYGLAPKCSEEAFKVRIFEFPFLNRTTHSFSWSSTSVFFQSLADFSPPTPPLPSAVPTWIMYNGPHVPQAGGEKVHMNLWLVNGKAPAHDVEVVINRFEAPSPRITGTVVGKGTGPQGTIQVDLRLSNTGTGAADMVRVNQLVFRTLSGTGQVTYNTSLSPTLPLPVGHLDIGGSYNIRLRLNVPPSVKRFSIEESGTMWDPGWRTVTFSTSQAIIP